MNWLRLVFEAPNDLSAVASPSETDIQKLARLNFVYGVTNVQEVLKTEYKFPKDFIKVDDGVVFIDSNKVKRMKDPLYLRSIGIFIAKVNEGYVILRRDILEASERILFENTKIAHATYNTFDGMPFGPFESDILPHRYY